MNFNYRYLHFPQQKHRVCLVGEAAFSVAEGPPQLGGPQGAWLKKGPFHTGRWQLRAYNRNAKCEDASGAASLNINVTVV